MPLTSEEIFYANADTVMSAETISAARATSVGNKAEELLLKSGNSIASDAERNEMFPEPKQGDVVWRSDLAVEQRYYELYSSSNNPQGRTPAGWYAVKNTFVPILSEYAFTSTNTVNLSNIFTNAFQNYLIIGSLDLNAGGNIYGYMLKDNARTASLAYQRARISGEVNATTSGVNSNDNVIMVAASNAGTTTKKSFKVTISNPMNASYTRAISEYSCGLLSSIMTVGTSSCAILDTVRYEGFAFYATASRLMTGVVSVYGYN